MPSTARILKKTFSFKFLETIETSSKNLLQHTEQLSVSTYKKHSLKDSINSTCVVCGNTHLLSVLDLGHQPLANAFVSDPTLALHQEEYRLHLVSCPSCSHVQLSATVNRSVLFKHYLYESGTSRTLITYFHWLAMAYAVTLVGHPAISLPLGVDKAGMPFGLQIVGPRGGDALVLAVAVAIEAAVAGDAALARPVPDIAALKAAAPIAAMPSFKSWA